MSLVLNNFIKNLFTTTSSEYRSLLRKLQTLTRRVVSSSLVRNTVCERWIRISMHEVSTVRAINDSTIKLSWTPACVRPCGPARRNFCCLPGTVYRKSDGPHRRTVSYVTDHVTQTPVSGIARATELRVHFIAVFHDTADPAYSGTTHASGLYFRTL